MKLILTFLLLSFELFASNILSYKIYERGDRTDLLLTFDTPYAGRISQKETLNSTTLLLYDTHYKEQTSKPISSAFLTQFSIIPQNNRTAIVLSLGKDVTFKVSKTVDNYGLRLRFYKQTSAKPIIKPTTSIATSTSTLRTKPDSQSNTNYIYVVIFLILAIFILLLIKKRIDKNGTGKSWLFKDGKSSSEQFNILFQKPIDATNKVVLLEVNQRQYLVILGNSHLLLDTYGEHQITNEDGFESILRDNQEELNSYMKIPENQTSTDPLQSYKDKASLEAYRSHM
jgi:hypothetical protein